jgi:alkanesulfonate monooxygenase SsuD/methylene tetrahydromethanopterin reductase-like flavin-dependent oxidoreductase (luciferase family)
VVGDPTQVIEKILDLRAVLGIDRFLGQIDYGAMPREQVESSLDLLGTVVAPAVRHVMRVSA